MSNTILHLLCFVHFVDSYGPCIVHNSKYKIKLFIYLWISMIIFFTLTVTSKFTLFIHVALRTSPEINK